MAGNRRKINVIFICTGNTCRSQMAEGWARNLKSDEINAWSAGTHPGTLNPLAVGVMRDAGVDISGHYPKLLEDIPNVEPDYIIAVCSSAAEQCPVIPGRFKRINAFFDDPPELAGNAESKEDALGHYRRVRDEIRAFVEEMPRNLEDQGEQEGSRQPEY